MRKISVHSVIEAVKNLCIEANCEIRPDTLAAYHKALQKEKSEIGKNVIQKLIENATIAKKEGIAFCQDTGYAVLFLEVGQEVVIEGGLLRDALQEGVRKGYREGYLRKSILCSPVCPKNTGDNTPALIHYEIVPGDRLKISLLVKGAGCDNKSRIAMFTPAEGIEAVKDFIVQTIDIAGASASPPLVVGIGLGGPFAQSAYLAQKALLWPVGELNPDPKLADLELELLERINNLGIGPAGFGGTVTALGVHIEAGPTHIASIPVAVNIDCHSHRGKEITL